MKNIYILRYPSDLYRTQTFVSVLMDKYDEWNVCMSYFRFTRLTHRNIFTRIAKLFILIIDLFFCLFNILRSDYVYVTAMSLGNRINYYLFKFSKWCGKKIVSEFYISMYDTLVLDRKTVLPTSRKSKFLQHIDRDLHHSDLTIYLNRTEAQRYTSLVGLALAEVNACIIPLTIEERKKAKLEYYSDKKQCFNIVWWGTYIPLHGLEYIIDTIRLLKNEGENIHLYILGNSEEKSKKYEEFVQQNNLEQYISIRNDLSFRNGRLEPFLVSNCHLAMGAFGDSDKARNVILNKCIEAVAMKIPVLTQYSNAFEEFFPASSETLFYCKNTPTQMSLAIKSIMNYTTEKVKINVENAHKIYSKNFSVESSKKKYAELLQNLN